MELNDYTGIVLAGHEGRPQELGGEPTRLQATKKLIHTIQNAQLEHTTPEAFADWLANYMEGYGAYFAHPSIDLSEGAAEVVPQCSFCGASWLFCGHAHMSKWKPITNESDTERDTNQ